MSIIDGRCPTCGATMVIGALYCPACGQATPTQPYENAPHRRSPTGEDLDGRGRLQRALGRGFTLGRLLGHGGFAEVYAATDVRLQRTVAVKALRPELIEDRNTTQRFLREARAVANLRHPGIVPIYYVSESEGAPFFVMPVIDGESLREYLNRSGPLPITETIRILAETVEALAVAHAAGLVHRDVKPENIMLEGSERRAIVMDFGIAKAVETSETTLTLAGAIIGTPQYMSPEQASAESTDQRSDIYSLGVVAFEMLTGRLPFQGDSLRELLLAHLATEPTNPRTLRAEIPDGLSNVILKCLQKSAGGRWSNAAELARVLRGIQPQPVLGQHVRRSAFVTLALMCMIAFAVTLARSGARADLWQMVAFMSPLALALRGWWSERTPALAVATAPHLELDASFESGLYGGLLGGALGGMFISALYGGEMVATGFPVELSLLAQIVLTMTLAGAVFGATILVGASWLRSRVHMRNTLRRAGAEVVGAVAGGVAGGAAVGVLVALLFAKRDIPIPSATTLFTGTAFIGAAIVAGVLLYDYRGKATQLLLPFVGASVVTTFAVVFTVALFPYEQIASQYWNVPLGHVPTTSHLAIGGLLIGVIGGVMLGTQTGGTMAGHRLWRTLRSAT